MTVTLEDHDGVALIRIDDGNRNVINHGVLDEFEAAWSPQPSSPGFPTRPMPRASDGC
jgi:hypothetical protein